MTDFFYSLTDRALQAEPGIQPLIPSRHEPYAGRWQPVLTVPGWPGSDVSPEAERDSPDSDLAVARPAAWSAPVSLVAPEARVVGPAAPALGDILSPSAPSVPDVPALEAGTEVLPPIIDAPENPMMPRQAQMPSASAQPMPERQRAQGSQRAIPPEAAPVLPADDAAAPGHVTPFPTPTKSGTDPAPDPASSRDVREPLSPPSAPPVEPVEPIHAAGTEALPPIIDAPENPMMPRQAQMPGASAQPMPERQRAQGSQRAIPPKAVPALSAEDAAAPPSASVAPAVPPAREPAPSRPKSLPQRAQDLPLVETESTHTAADVPAPSAGYRGTERLSSPSAPLPVAPSFPEPDLAAQELSPPSSPELSRSSRDTRSRWPPTRSQLAETADAMQPPWRLVAPANPSRGDVKNPRGPHRGAQDPPPTIRITIGRVEIHAARPIAPPAAIAPPALPRPALSLQDYLQQRSGGQR